MVEETAGPRETKLDLTVNLKNLVEIGGKKMIPLPETAQVVSNLEARNTKLLYKKVGFVLETLGVKGLSPAFYDLCRQRMANRRDDLRDYPSEPGLSSSEWNLAYPEYMKEIE